MRPCFTDCVNLKAFFILSRLLGFTGCFILGRLLGGLVRTGSIDQRAPQVRASNTQCAPTIESPPSTQYSPKARCAAAEHLSTELATCRASEEHLSSELDICQTSKQSYRQEMMVLEKLVDKYGYVLVCGPGAEFQTGVHSPIPLIGCNSSAGFPFAFIV